MRKKVLVGLVMVAFSIILFTLQWWFNIRAAHHMAANEGVLDFRGTEPPAAFVISDGFLMYPDTIDPDLLSSHSSKSSPMHLFGGKRTYFLEILVDDVHPLSMLDFSGFVTGISVGKPYIYSAYVRPDTLVSLTGESAASNLWRKLPEGYSFEIVLQTDFSQPSKEYLDPIVFGDPAALSNISNYHTIFSAVPLGVLVVMIALSLALYTKRQAEHYLLWMAFAAGFALLWCFSKATIFRADGPNHLAFERVAYAGTLSGVFLLSNTLSGRTLSQFDRLSLVFGAASALLALASSGISQSLPRIHIWLCEPLLQSSLLIVARAFIAGDRRALLLLAGVAMFDVVHLYALLSDMGLVPANVGSLLFDPQLFALLAMMLAMMLYTGRSFSNSHRLTADLNMQLANLNETLEQRIDQKTADLLDAYERLKQERMKNNELMTNIFHNLRSPLFAIRGFSGILLKSTKGEVKSMVERIHNNTEYLCRTSEDLFLTARLQEHRIELNILEVNMVELINQVAGSLSILAQQKAVSFSVLHEGAVFADCDPYQMQTVLRNMLENCIRFSPENGTITITAKEEINGALIRITDEGGGLKLEDEGRIFERYYTNRKQNGDSGSTGLGLHISRLIIELHGGAIRAGNVKSGPGAEFVIQLPAR